MWEDDCFDMDFFEVGNPMYLGLAEEIFEKQFNSRVDDLYARRDGEITSEEMAYLVEDLGLEDADVPAWMLRKLDSFTIIDE